MCGRLSESADSEGNYIKSPHMANATYMKNLKKASEIINLFASNALNSMKSTLALENTKTNASQ